MIRLNTLAAVSKLAVFKSEIFKSELPIRSISSIALSGSFIDLFIIKLSIWLLKSKNGKLVTEVSVDITVIRLTELLTVVEIIVWVAKENGVETSAVMIGMVVVKLIKLLGVSDSILDVFIENEMELELEAVISAVWVEVISVDVDWTTKVVDTTGDVVDAPVSVVHVTPVNSLFIHLTHSIVFIPK